jgi:hypothetical protein
LNISRLRTPLFFLAAVTLLLFLTMSCGSDDSKAEKPAGTPDNWEHFEAGPWSGWIDPSWKVLYVTSNNVDDPRIKAQLPAASLNVAKAMFETTRIKQSTYIFVDLLSSPPKTINLLGCFRESESTKDDQIIEKFRALGIPAAIRGSALFNDVRWNVAQVDPDPSVGTIQVYPNQDGCYMTFTFTTVRGQDDSAAEFVRFVQSLEADTSKLQK